MSAGYDFVANGKSVRVATDETTPLLSVLRDELGLRGSRFGCGTEQCGACMVLIDGEAVHACTRAVSLDHATRALRFSDVPKIDIQLIDNPNEPALGLGEASVGPTGAAIGNAVARALGQRIRDLPLTRERIMATLLA